MGDAGMNHSQASRQLGIHCLRCSAGWLVTSFRRGSIAYTQSLVDEHGSYLDKRYREGCRKIMQLWQELKERGFEGQSSTVRSLLRHRFGSPKNALEVHR